MQNIQVVALYQFVQVDDVASMVKTIKATFGQYGDLRGTLILAHEGINGTIAASPQTMAAVLSWFEASDVFNIGYKTSYCQENPFLRFKVKHKKEIVTIGDASVNPNEQVGTYVAPKDWNQLIQDPEVVVIDTRNDYECAIGQFKGAINPKTDTFRAFPEYVAENFDPKKHKKVAMYCTGGIRCEKASSLMLKMGFESVYHLKGGILQYLEDVDPSESTWEGDCFVFDQRVAVDHALNPSGHLQCFACRRPLIDSDLTHQDYTPGVSCHHCIQETSEAQKRHFTERQKQHELAKQRGEQHIGHNHGTQ